MGGVRELLCAYGCALMIVRMCHNFQCEKLAEKTFAACIGEIGETFFLAKISMYMVDLYAFIVVLYSEKFSQMATL